MLRIFNNNSLAGLMLNEAFTGKVIDKNLRHKQLKKAQEKRIAYNKQARCNNCTV